MMYIAIDLILFVIMFAAIYSAVKRGFVHTLFGTLRLAVSCILASVFCKDLGVYVNEKYVCGYVEPYISDFIKEKLVEGGKNFTADMLENSLPDGISKLVGMLNIDIPSMFGNHIGDSTDLVSKLTNTITAAFSNIIAYVILFFAAYILLGILCMIFDNLTKLPVLGGIDKTLGFVLGVVEALVLGIIISKTSLAICSVYGATNNDPLFLEVSEKTVIAKYLASLFPW